MASSGYRGKVEEAAYHLREVHAAFLAADPNLVHALNAFLSAAQSVIWTLNKAFSKRSGYTKWQEARSGRLPPDAKLFKELRNVSVKEAPVRNNSVIVEFRLGDGTSQAGLGPHETFTSPFINSLTGQVLGKATVTSADAKTTREVDALALHDFGVEVTSDGKTHSLPAFVTAGRTYLAALAREIAETERRFGGTA